MAIFNSLGIATKNQPRSFFNRRCLGVLARSHATRVLGPVRTFTWNFIIEINMKIQKSTSDDLKGISFGNV